MKIIDKYVIRSFIWPYILFFFIAEFVLVIQFLWKYIDEILGKGFSIFEILELIIYYGMTIVPMALPISILVASVMVFGDMAEKHELPSLKSAGISLTRVMRGGFILAILTFCLSLFASNYLKPTANFQFKKRFDVIRKQKSTLTIEEKIFNADFNNYIIRVKKKYPDGRSMKDVLIYDHTQPDKSLLNLIACDSAEMYSTDDGRYFVMKLYDGVQYREETREKDKQGRIKYPLYTTKFRTFEKILDMSEFYLDENDLSFNRKREDMLNTLQLLEAIDSIDAVKTESAALIKIDYDKLLPDRSLPDIDYNEERTAKSTPDTATFVAKKTGSEKPPSSLYQTLDSTEFQGIINRALAAASSRSDIAFGTMNKIESLNFSRNAYLYRLNQQYSFAFVCLIFFFIGAPLGSIIRKGGYGYSLLVAILFYMVFIICSIFGEKLIKSGEIDGILGAWIPCIILLPFGLLFTQQALNDVKFDLPARISRLFSRNN